MTGNERRWLWWVLVATALAALASGCASGGQDRDELAVSRVVLYQNGVGYFERRGRVSGEALRLRVRPDQINDMLTSLTVIDRSGGGAATVSLPVEKSASMALGELPPELRNQGGLVGVLSALRGAQVDVSARGGGASGQLVGLEPIAASSGAPGSWRLTILTSGGELVPIDVDDITGVQLEDEVLQVGLEKALDVAMQADDWKPVELVVRFADDSARDVVLSYVVAMPTWKPAYRLIFGGEGEARLQGWAVVDNVSGEDWEDVTLSLTAGAPISFVVDLHTPRLPRRPDLTGRTYTAVAEAPPETLEGFAANAPPPPPAPRAQARRSRSASGSASAPSRDDAWAAEADDDGDWSRQEAQAISSAEMMGSLGQETATGAELGSLFRYDINGPVTVPDRSSALVTIINTEIDGEDIFLYDPTGGSARSQRHPYRAVRLNNTSAFVIERGPLTIYDDATFVGEGITSQIAPGETAFIPYALESSVGVHRAGQTAATEQRLIKVKDGVATVEVVSIQRQSFEVRNNGDEPVSVYVRVDRLAGHELRAPEDVIQQGEVFFARVDAGARDVAETEVVQARTLQRSLTMADPALMQAIALYVSDVDADPRLKASLEPLLALQSERGEVEHRRQALQRTQSELQERTRELRNNIRVLGDSAANRALKAQLVSRLGEAEEQLGAITRELVELSERQHGIEVQMREAFEMIDSP